MDDYSKILDYVRRNIELTKEEEDYFVSLLRIKKLQKRQFLVQPDYICHYKSYVLSGALRSYFVGNNGEQYTVALAVDDWWISDFNSYINQTPATLFVEALENTTLIQIEFNAQEELMRRIPKFERLFRILGERAFAAAHRRVLSQFSKSAEDRYLEFIELYPNIANRIPQYAIASYLGFTTEFLSKIRKRLSVKS